jgi:hypothetical protein
MNRFVIFFFIVLLTSRFFSETLKVLPKAVDLLDVVVIPVLFIVALVSGSPRGSDRRLHNRVLSLSVAFACLAGISAVVNYERCHIGPTLLYIFGMLEGPFLFVSLNLLIRDKKKFGRQLANFVNVMVLIEIFVVLFVNMPVFLATNNPDKVSGTFGNNAYQFSAFLVLMGGYYLGRQATGKKAIVYTVALQIFIFFTFVLLQFRAAVPAFFAAYGVMAAALYGRKLIRLAFVVLVFIGIGYYAFTFVQESNFNLKYEDFQTLYENPEIVLNYGKAISYANTVDLFSEEPLALLIGTGPGTYVSRASYTFTMELYASKEKGVGSILKTIFGDVDYSTDIEKKYIDPLNNLGALFGSVQANNPNSSVLAIVAETGIPGLIIMGMLYGAVIMLARRYLTYAKAIQDPMLIQLSCALLGGISYLCMISPLDNYFEVGRVTLPIWLLFWTVSTLVEQSRYGSRTSLSENKDVNRLSRGVNPVGPPVRRPLPGLGVPDRGWR